MSDSKEAQHASQAPEFQLLNKATAHGGDRYSSQLCQSSATLPSWAGLPSRAACLLLVRQDSRPSMQLGFSCVSGPPC
jgi:hypothetical protein